VELMSDLVQRVPGRVLLAIVAVSALGAPVLAALVGGPVSVWILLVGVAILLLSGGALALKVHVNRLPLRLSGAGVRTRLDGHVAYQFRAQLGRGRRMDRARATVRFLPDHGEPISLEPLMDRGERLVGPWTLVVVDRQERIRGPGSFEVRVQVKEGERDWEAETAYRDDALVEGRFVSALSRRSADWLSKSPPFDAVEPVKKAG